MNSRRRADGDHCFRHSKVRGLLGVSSKPELVNKSKNTQTAATAQLKNFPELFTFFISGMHFKNRVTQNFRLVYQDRDVKDSSARGRRMMFSSSVITVFSVMLKLSQDSSTVDRDIYTFFHSTSLGSTLNVTALPKQ